MKNSNFEELVEEYKECIKLNAIIDYGNKSEVRKANKAVDRMIKISRLISEKYPSRIYDFAELLSDKDFRTDIWVAHHILENMVYSGDLEARALNVIIEYSKEDSVNGLGNRMWLENWYRKAKDDLKL
ncbi:MULTISPECIES: hypothetical protein [unclassified Dehalobacter]|uniref:hypothetical protein n=1 Tax=unclassified Dehalobacter TaxID=2635733 RepID=UPI00104F4740|nr:MULTISPECIES: hypothetical protein [unclassified Dehalobacter]TCX49161.1 hypothetical protein C1I36_10700 [Dehalobacter sp. 14DCB1]TCX55307.1 hypothetical protein C1I38_03570 [Dehalobacter sp. 12DCB1]